MAGFINVRVDFPVLKGLRENDLIALAESIIEDGMKRAIDRIVAKWYTFVQSRTGRSGSRSNWNLAKLGVMSYAVQNLARTPRGKLYAGFIHRAGQTSTLEDTLVRREIAKARKEITSSLLGLRATGQAPVGSISGAPNTAADIILDLFMSAFSESLPSALAAK